MRNYNQKLERLLRLAQQRNEGPMRHEVSLEPIPFGTPEEERDIIRLTWGDDDQWRPRINGRNFRGVL